jgi:GAF domain-containing protein
LQHENARLKALIPLYEISRSLMTTIDLEALLDQVVEMAIQETGADRASLMLEENGELTLVAARGLPEEIVRKARTRIGEGIAGWVAKHGKPLLLDKSVSMPPELADALTRAEIASAVCVPLIVKDRVIGVLNLTKFEGTEHPFTPSDRDLISVLAGQVAVAIENARLFKQQRAITEQLTRANANLQALQQAATATTSRLSPQRVLQTILDGCAAVMENATIALGLLDPEHSHIEVHLHHGDTKARDVITLALSEEEVAALETIAGVKSVLTERLSALVQSHSKTTEIGVIPLEVRDQLLGAMAVGTPGGLTEAEISTLKPFADQAAVAITNARLFTQLQQAYEDLQETNRLKSESVQAVVRDLQTPLSAIRSYAELLEEKVAVEDKVYLRKLREAVTQLENYIAELMTMEGRAVPDNGPA